MYSLNNDIGVKPTKTILPFNVVTVSDLTVIPSTYLSVIPGHDLSVIPGHDPELPRHTKQLRFRLTSPKAGVKSHTDISKEWFSECCYS